MKAKEKRKVRGYKISDKPYLVAMKRAKKNGSPLASLIEKWVTDFGKDAPILINFKGAELSKDCTVNYVPMKDISKV